ncbi:MAG: V-type ATPase subunit [Clostridia bacterium]|nr:V-type ATPase subunit [Clostridia bacterium]
MKKLQPTEYMYASARIRALENRLVGRERIELLIEARSADEVMDRLAEFGLSPAESDAEASTLSAGEAQSRAREEMLLAVLREAYTEVETSVPDPAVFRYFRYPYDCNNLKAAIKCAVRGISAEDLLFDFGTVPADEVEALLREGKYDKFPAAMAAAVPVAKEAYDKTADPRRIDTILDRACYAAMLDDATASGDEVLMGWLKAKIDLTNILITLRILRMGMGSVGAAFLEESLLPGGTLDGKFFAEAYEGGEDRLWEAITPTAYGKLAAVEGDPRPLSAVEKTADDLYMELVRKDAKTPFGAPVVGGYLAGCETAVKNIRIILAAKDAELDSAVIRERIRVSYV